MSSTQEATEPRARKKSRGPAQRPTQDRLFREWAEPVPSLGPGQGQTRGLLCSLGSGTSRAALGLEAQRTGRGDRWVAGWGPGCFAPNHTQSPACRLACRHPSHLLTSGALEPPRRVDAGGAQGSPLTPPTARVTASSLPVIPLGTRATEETEGCKWPGKVGSDLLKQRPGLAWKAARPGAPCMPHRVLALAFGWFRGPGEPLWASEGPGVFVQPVTPPL